MMGRPVGRAGRYRDRHAFTLLEVVVVAVVASIIFAFLARWFLTLGEIGNHGLTQAGAARAVSAVDSALSADLQQATGCGVAHSPVHTLAPDTFAFYVYRDDAPVPAGTYLVSYRADGTTVTRHQVLLDATCTPVPGNGSDTGVRVLASGLAPFDPARPAFTGYIGATSGGSCQTAARDAAAGLSTWESTGSGCDATAVAVDLVATPDGADGGRDQLTRSYPIRTLEGGL